MPCHRQGSRLRRGGRERFPSNGLIQEWVVPVVPQILDQSVRWSVGIVYGGRKRRAAAEVVDVRRSAEHLTTACATN